VNLWFEWEIPESADSNIDQPERRMIDANVAAAFRAITTTADVAALESPKKLSAVRDTYIFSFPQRERADRRSGITPALTMRLMPSCPVPK